MTKLVELDDRLMIAHTSSWLGWVCLAVLGVSGVLGIGLGVQVLRASQRSVGDAVLLVIGGTLCVLLGFVVQTLGQMTIVDRAAGTVRSGWSTLGFWWSRQLPLAAFKAVSVTTGDHARRRVHLVGMTSQKVAVVYVTEYATTEEALTTAERIAGFAGLEVFDETPTADNARRRE